MDDQGATPGRDRVFSLRHSIHTGQTALSAFYIFTLKLCRHVYFSHYYLMACPFNQLTGVIHKLDRIIKDILTNWTIFCDIKQCSPVKVNFVSKFDLLCEF
jgi:hypothetical protein